jgi:hypothetical protein
MTRFISGIGWASEAIELVGGEDIFLRPNARALRERQVESGAVCAADPQFIFASWCGKPVHTDQIRLRAATAGIGFRQSGREKSTHFDSVQTRFFSRDRDCYAGSGRCEE